MIKILFFLLAFLPQIFSQTFVDTFYVNPLNDGFADGQTLETGWKDFTKFNINVDVLSNSLLLVTPSVYTKGDTSYHLSGERNFAILYIRDRTNITIRKFGEGDTNEVYFAPDDTIKYGLWIQPSSENKRVNNITVERIFFNNCSDNAIRISGHSYTNRVNNIYLKNCNIEQFSSNSGIFCQRADNIYIESCFLYSHIFETNDNHQNDGIYFQNTNNIFIRNNEIIVCNNYNGSVDPPHVDCIQITKDTLYPSSNIEILNNAIENSSDINDYINRQGIHITNTSGYIRIWNNIIKSNRGDGLINIHYTYDNSELTVYNNTLYGMHNQRNLMQIVYYPNTISGQIPETFAIKNNILYKAEGGSTLYTLKLVNIDTLSVTNNLLNNNLYYIGNHPNVADYRTCFAKFDSSYYDEYTLLWNHFGENKSKAADPLFSSIGDLHLSYGSPAKNLGVGLKNEGLLTDYDGEPRPYWNADYDCGAFEIQGDAQLKIGIASGQNQYFKLRSLGTNWEKNSSGNFVISQNSNYTSSIYEVASVDNNSNNWKGWDLGWLSSSSDENEQFAHGIYKLSCYPDTTIYIYLDFRDAVTNYSPNIFINLQNFDGVNNFQISTNGIFDTTYIPNGSVYRIWDLNNGSISNSSLLNNFWNNSLVCTNKDNHPFLIWGPNDSLQTNGYYFYKYIMSETGWVNLATYSNESYYLDSLESYVMHMYDHPVKYKILADNSLSSNIVTTLVNGAEIEKQNHFEKMVPDFSLSQNYPNPFNPATKINYSLKENSFVKLQVYDILGKLVSTLVNEPKSAGKYEVDFNASNLSSGIYFYRISAGNMIKLKKMQVLK